MLPGTKYSVEDIARILRRRLWLLTICAAVGLLVGSVVETREQKRFKSETLIMVVPQRIPDSYVRTTVTAKIEDRLQSISQQILSRSRLERIIVDFNLYANERRVQTMEDVVARMRADIQVSVERGDSFRVSYTSTDARTAQKVTERIAGLFIEENLRDRENLAEDTNRFLESELNDAKARLVEQERKLEAYNKKYGGQLPSQAAANLDRIHNAQLRSQALAEAMDRGRERRLALENQLADVDSNEPATAAAQPPAAGNDSPQGAPLTQQLDAARARLRLLETHATADHPDVRALQRTVRDLEAKVQAENAAAAAAPKTLTPTEALRQRRARDLRAVIAAVDRELEDLRQQDKRLTAAIADYQAKVDAVPTREAELVELTRDYTTLQTSYQSLLAKQEESKIAANMERRNIGDQFKILDPARVPQRSVTPTRIVFAAGGAAAGLALGLVLVALFEYRDESFSREEQVVRVLSVPVLAVVPLMTGREVAEPWWRRLGATSIWRARR